MRVGYVISRRPPTNSSFEFELEEPGSVAVGDFVEVPLDRGALLARVAKAYVENQLLSSPGLVREHSLYGLKLPSRAALETSEVHVARAEAVGIVAEDGIHPPSTPPTPGSPVYTAAGTSLARLLGFVEGGVRLGRVWRSGVEAVLDAELLLKHHVAVLGATGSGKSYTCGVLAEEVLELGLPLVVLDPHGEYATLSERYRVRRLRADRVAIPPGEVSPDAIAEATEMSDVQRDLLYLAWQEAEGPYLEDLEEAVRRVTAQYRFRDETLIALVRRLRVLKAYGAFTGKGERLELAEGEALIIDVGLGMPEHVTRALAGSIVWRLFEARKLGDTPPFALIVDEAQRFLPVDEETFSRTALRTVAREGRKFGASLTIASQRVVGLDKDVLSQCGTKILLRMDSPTDLAMLKPALGSYAKLLPHLPTGVALVTGVSARYPVLVEVRGRKTTHGGSGVKLRIKAPSGGTG
ncbi:MAG: ATP-binding protein [Thermofilaceae archaeon]